MVHEELIETLPLYAAGALDRAERQEIDTHLLTGCPACHSELKEFQAVASLLPFGLPPIAPPRTLKPKIMGARNSLQPAPEIVKRPLQSSLEPGEWMKHLFPPAPRFPTWATPAFAALGLIFAASFLYMGYAVYVRTLDNTAVVAAPPPPSTTALERIAQLQGQVQERDATIARISAAAGTGDNAVAELREAIILREAELDDLRNQLVQRDKDLAVLKRGRAQSDDIAGFFRSASARPILLVGSEGGRGASGLVLFDQAGGKAFFYAYNLPSLPPDRVYQLWAIDVKPLSGGTFTPDIGQKSRLSVKGLPPGARISKFAVTVEPAGGQPLPTGTIYLSGTL